MKTSMRRDCDLICGFYTFLGKKRRNEDLDEKGLRRQIQGSGDPTLGLPGRNEDLDEKGLRPIAVRKGLSPSRKE